MLRHHLLDAAALPMHCRVLLTTSSSASGVLTEINDPHSVRIVPRQQPSLPMWLALASAPSSKPRPCKPRQRPKSLRPSSVARLVCPRPQPLPSCQKKSRPPPSTSPRQSLCRPNLRFSQEQSSTRSAPGQHSACTVQPAGPGPHWPNLRLVLNGADLIHLQPGQRRGCSPF